MTCFTSRLLMFQLQNRICVSPFAFELIEIHSRPAASFNDRYRDLLAQPLLRLHSVLVREYFSISSSTHGHFHASTLRFLRFLPKLLYPLDRFGHSILAEDRSLPYTGQNNPLVMVEQLHRGNESGGKKELQLVFRSNASSGGSASRCLPEKVGFIPRGASALIGRGYGGKWKLDAAK